jgi:Flp pilus assembly protein CpaB
MKRRSWLWLLASAILAVLAGVLAIMAIRNQAGSGDGTPVPKQPVVLAAGPIPANTILRADNLMADERQTIKSGAAVDVQDVIGARTLRDFAQGEEILMQDLNFSMIITGTNPWDTILEDKIAIALPATDILSQWGAVLPGDHVDLLFTVDTILEAPMMPDLLTPAQVQSYVAVPRDQSMDNVSVLTLQNLEVLQVLEEPQTQAEQQGQQQEAQQVQPRQRALLLKIDPQDAVILKYIRDSQGKIDVALRSSTNNTLFDVDPVNINYLVLRYGITLPQPLK